MTSNTFTYSGSTYSESTTLSRLSTQVSRPTTISLAMRVNTVVLPSVKVAAIDRTDGVPPLFQRLLIGPLQRDLKSIPMAKRQEILVL